MITGISRKISYSGDDEYSKSFTALACSLFDNFVRNVRLGNLNSGTGMFPINNTSYINFWLNGNSGSIHIHAEKSTPSRVVDIEITRRDVICHWNKKEFYTEAYNQHTGLWETTRIASPALFHSHGFGQIAFAISDWEVLVLNNYAYGENIVCRPNKIDAVDTDFFEDDMYVGAYPTHKIGGNTSLRSGWDFAMITKRVWRHRAWLTRDVTATVAWEYSTISVDGLVPVAPGVIGGFQVQTPLLSSGGNILRKGRTKFVAHGSNPVDEKQDVMPVEITSQLSSANILSGYTQNAGLPDAYPWYGSTIFGGSGGFGAYSPSRLQDFVGKNLICVLTGSTSVGGLLRETHDEVDGVLFDYYYYATENSASLTVQSLQEDGSVSTFSIPVLIEKTIQYSLFPIQSTYHRSIRPVSTQPGAVIEEEGGCYACCLYDVYVIGGNRNCVYIATFEGVPHPQFDYNLIINEGSGFVPYFVSGGAAQKILHARSWANSALAFVHNYGSPFCFSYLRAHTTEPIVDLLVGHFAYHGDGKQKEMRFFSSKDYRWFVLYNAVDADGLDISGVYEFNGSSIMRRGDATGIEPVEFAHDESYLLMQDRAYGSISGTFDRLVGFFYDNHHYLEMQGRPEDHLKRFVIKNLDGQTIKQTEFGAYSFYETAADGSMAIISHCAINGVSQSTGGGVMLAVNFTDGPFEFETLCHAIVYNFTLGVENGYTDNFKHAPELGSPYYGPPNSEPPYGRKQISICHCTQNVGGTTTRHRHHVMISPSSGYVIGDRYCMHRPGFYHQRVSNISVRTLYGLAKQQRGLDPLVENQVVTLLALPHGYFYERITDEVGPVDPRLLDSGEYVSEVITTKEQ